jgi:hypothetical protein
MLGIDRLDPSYHIFADVSPEDDLIEGQGDGNCGDGHINLDDLVGIASGIFQYGC